MPKLPKPLKSLKSSNKLMSKDEKKYNKILSTVDIGEVVNNRQQVLVKYASHIENMKRFRLAPSEQEKFANLIESSKDIPAGTRFAIMTYPEHAYTDREHWTVVFQDGEEEHITTRHLKKNGSGVKEISRDNSESDDNGRQSDESSKESDHGGESSNRNSTTSDRAAKASAPEPPDSDQERIDSDEEHHTHSEDENERNSNPFG